MLDNLNRIIQRKMKICNQKSLIQISLENLHGFCFTIDLL